MAQPIMNALDAIAGSQASAYITLADGNRYCFMQLYSFESKMDISVPLRLTVIALLRRFGRARTTASTKLTSVPSSSIVRLLIRLRRCAMRWSIFTAL